MREGGELVDETLGRKAGMRMAHRAPPLDRNVDFSLVVLDCQIGNRIGEIVGALDGRGIVSLFLHHALELCSSKYRLTHET